jgi:hypothetical protein
MKRRFGSAVVALVATALAGGGALAAAAGATHQCRDAKGKFVKCPAAGAPKQQCKDAKGKFVKCGTPGAVPVKKP